MSESSKHVELIKIIKQFVEEKEDIEKAFLRCDLMNEYKTESLINGYRPDLFYKYKGKVIIGEAKTKNDIDRKHSIEQYKSFLEYCNLNGENAKYIISVPWTETIYAKKILKRLKIKFNYDIKILVLNDVKKVCEI